MAKRHEQSKETKNLARILAMSGLTDPEIARHVRCSEATLKRHYAEELHEGRILANAQVVAALFKQAISGRFPYVGIYWTKARCGWRDVPDEPPSREPIQINVRVTSKGERIKAEDYGEN